MKKGYLTDLHLHLDGSLSADAIRKLANMQDMEVPSKNDELMKHMQVNENCQDLVEYLKCFDYTLSFLQTREAIEESVYMLLQECKERDFQYVEVRFAPQLHLQKGLSQRDVVEAALRGWKRASITSGLILCCMRLEDNHEQNIETIKLAAEYLGKGVCGIDIAGDELHFPIENYVREFALAKEYNIPVTIHAGEAAGPESVWKALDFGAARIGHGVRSVEDEKLLGELAKRGTVLELCPTSNLNTRVFEKIEEYPLRKLMDAGVKITINSDNMTVSNTDVKKELSLLEKTFLLTAAEVLQLKKNSIEAIFAEKEIKEQLKQHLI